MHTYKACNVVWSRSYIASLDGWRVAPGKPTFDVTVCNCPMALVVGFVVVVDDTIFVENSIPFPIARYGGFGRE